LYEVTGISSKKSAHIRGGAGVVVVAVAVTGDVVVSVLLSGV
jgi:hypothetical protein